jgi:hypothetical protein
VKPPGEWPDPPGELSPPRIVCAANRHRKSGLIVCAPRHFDATMHAVLLQLDGDWRTSEQGFVDQHGKFYTREEAWKIAEANGQLLRRFGGDGVDLYSENLY